MSTFTTMNNFTFYLKKKKLIKLIVFRESLIKLNSKRGHTFFFYRYDRILAYGIHSMKISLYHQAKTPTGFGVDRVQTPNLLFDTRDFTGAGVIHNVLKYGLG